MNLKQETIRGIRDSIEGAIDELEEIQEEMVRDLERARALLRDLARNSGEGENSVSELRTIYSRADAYWLAHLRIDLTKDHGYLARSMCDMSDTISELDDLRNELTTFVEQP